ncbi:MULTISPECIES: HNH endonuclease [unclassified Thiocapsa]|uniref:HNH endonuclease n=1 Tax=unclassified Thiocapsa TaxID=2641286 RepID=UPI0035B19C58
MASQDLIIQYQDGEGNITERRISDIQPEHSRAVEAFCHLRNARRIFYVPRILTAAYADSGEVVVDLYAHWGLPEPEQKKTSLISEPDATGRIRGHSAQAYKSQRNKEKRELFRRFLHPTIARTYKEKFFALFDGQCFKCASRYALVIDHHVPMIKGGHFVPGNLVALCRICNNNKLDLDPENFYTQEELERLKPLLDQERHLFDFQFDRERWENDREAYLLDLGVQPDLINEILYNPDHLNYVGLETSQPAIFISLSPSSE